MLRRVAVILALCLAQAAHAEAPAQQAKDGAIPLGLAQKRAFAKSLVEDAAVQGRIHDSHDVEAEKLLGAAQDSYRSALAALEGGDFASAEKLLNDCMAAMGRARRRAPDVAAATAKQRADYQKLLESVASLQKSCANYQKRAKPPATASGEEANDRANLNAARLVETAKAQAAENHMDDALQTMGKAEQILKSALGRMLGATVVNYTQKFASQAEEYAYESERNRSLMELIPVAIEELRPTEDERQTMESLIEQDRAAVDLAEQYVQLSDYEKALANMRSATNYLQFALSAAGLVIPHSAGMD
jgi:hypothetical protein